MAMIDPSEATQHPRNILLATDLSSRGDRALDRAAQLAGHWGAGLHVVHAVDALPPSIPVGVNAEAYLRSWPDPKPQARRRLAALVDDTPSTLHIEDGPPTQAILAVAEREACDLIVLGEGRDRIVGPFESTLDGVIRKAAASVLVVRSRPARPYRHLVVGTDYTDEALQALVRATSLFPDAAITFVHAYATPYAGLRGDRVPDQPWIEQERAKLRDHLDAANIAPAVARAIKLQVDVGPPAAVLPKCIAESSADLTVIGAHPRGLVYDAVLGSTRLIVDAIPGDILMVRAVRRDG
jgi:nucleotide-binding universal stress UspA family protein